MQKAIRSKHESIFASISAYENPWLLPSQIDQVFSKLLQKKKNFYEGSSSNHGSNVDEMEQGNDCVCFAHTNTHESTQAPNTHTHMHTRTKAPWHTGTPA